MPASEIICPSDILSRDLFVYDNIDDAVNELKDLAVNLNRTKLFYAWMLGKFLNDTKKLSTQYHTTFAEVAEKLGTSEQTLYRYRKVFQMITEAEVRQLGSMGVSVNAVIELAQIARGGHKEEAEKLLELVLSGQLQEVKELQSQFSSLIAHQVDAYNLLPGAEPPEASGMKSLESDVSEVKDEATTPGEKILETENDNGTAESEDSEDDVADSDGGADSQNRKDAKALLRQARQSIVALKRELAFNDLEEMIAKLEEHHSVIMGVKEFSDEFEEEMVELYERMCQAIALLSKQVAGAVKAGYVIRQIPLPQECVEAFNGQGLFD